MIFENAINPLARVGLTVLQQECALSMHNVSLISRATIIPSKVFFREDQVLLESDFAFFETNICMNTICPSVHSYQKFHHQILLLGVTLTLTSHFILLPSGCALIAIFVQHRPISMELSVFE